MSVDWITVAAQLANFLILVWLLKRFLYRPILDGIDAREAEIAERMQVAVRAKSQAQDTEADYRSQLAALRLEQASAADTARHQAEKERETLLSDAHDRIELERTAWRAHLDEETRKFTNEMHRAAGQALLELTRKALIDLADDTLEDRIAAHLTRKVAKMDGDLQHAAGNPDHAKVTSHVALSDTTQAQLTAELRRRFPMIVVHFETNTAQAPGVTLHLGGAHLEWTVDTYIEGLDALIAERLVTGSDNGVASA